MVSSIRFLSICPAGMTARELSGELSCSIRNPYVQGKTSV